MEKLIDTYVTVEEADAYINTRYRSNNPMRIAWGSVSPEDKEILLVNACAEMELLPFQGRKATIGQPLAFPRLPFQYGDVSDAPQNIKAAQIELALWMTDYTKQNERSKRKDLQAQGVKSFSIGDLSESYADTAGAKAEIYQCKKAISLLSPYLNGGYGMC